MFVDTTKHDFHRKSTNTTNKLFSYFTRGPFRMTCRNDAEGLSF